MLEYAGEVNLNSSAMAEEDATETSRTWAWTGPRHPRIVSRVRPYFNFRVRVVDDSDWKLPDWQNQRARGGAPSARAKLAKERGVCMLPIHGGSLKNGGSMTFIQNVSESDATGELKAVYKKTPRWICGLRCAREEETAAAHRADLLAMS